MVATCSTPKCISIHAPTRGATVARVYSGVQPYYFNPRSHEGSDYRFLKGSRSGYYFNPRSHEGSDVIRRVRFTGNGTISIHAPTRGATCRSWLTSYQILQISIHAPTRGATVARVYSGVQPYYFNPRSHEGSDYRFLKGSRSGYYFNPRSHEGSDDRVQCILCAITQFQSTLPRGERQCRLKYEIEQAEISIHAPTRGAT